MPMIDIHATHGTFGDVKKLATVRRDGQAAPMTPSSRTILVSIRHAGAKMPSAIGPSSDDTLARVRSVALYHFGISEDVAKDYKLFVGGVELVDLTETAAHLAGGQKVLQLDLGTTPNPAPRDPRFELTPPQIEQIMRIEADAAEFRAQMQRVGIDGSIVDLIGVRDESTTRRINTGHIMVVEQEYLVDDDKKSAAVRALQELPDGAGKEAFIVAYKNRLNSGR
jgi:hypothetical protein